jgi:sugar lactone lactonase YvrE
VGSPPSIEVYAVHTDILGEGPLWSVADGALYWLDIAQRRLYRKAPSESGDHAWNLPDYPGCLAEVGPETLAIAMGDGVQLFAVERESLQLQCSPRDRRPGTRFNDGKVDPSGRFWVGTMQNNFGPDGGPIPITRSDGALYRFDADGTVATLEENIGVSNTLAWSLEQKRFYFADSIPGCIYAYDYDAETGRIHNRRTHFDAPGFGIPDGSAIDVDGCLWNARWDGGAILRITPEGKVDRRIELPLPRPTSCIFGGPRFETLFVTSASQSLSAPDLHKFPLSGSVFAIHGLAQGMPVPAFTVDSTQDRT